MLLKIRALKCILFIEINVFFYGKLVPIIYGFVLAPQLRICSSFFNLFFLTITQQKNTTLQQGNNKRLEHKNELEVIQISLKSGSFYLLKCPSGIQEVVRIAGVEAMFSHTHHCDPSRQNT